MKIIFTQIDKFKNRQLQWKSLVFKLNIKNSAASIHKVLMHPHDKANHTKKEITALEVKTDRLSRSKIKSYPR